MRITTDTSPSEIGNFLHCRGVDFAHIVEHEGIRVRHNDGRKLLIYSQPVPGNPRLWLWRETGSAGKQRDGLLDSFEQLQELVTQ
jgi:hypothetical protein